MIKQAVTTANRLRIKLQLLFNIQEEGVLPSYRNASNERLRPDETDGAILHNNITMLNS